MKILSAMSLFSLIMASCSGIKVQKGSPDPQPTSKPGVTWGGSALSGGGIQKVGFHCAVKGKVLTFTNFGSTEAKATEDAMANCHKVHPQGPCALQSCKPAE